HMPGMTGIELHRRLVESGYVIPTILITAYPDESVRVRAMADGVLCYLTKPCDSDELLRCISSALERSEPGERHSGPDRPAATFGASLVKIVSSVRGARCAARA